MIRFGYGGEGVPFHDLAAGRASLPADSDIEIAPPAYRGKRLLPVLSWLVTNRVDGPGARATWRVERRHGPDYVRRALEPFGWRLEPERAARWLLLHGEVPAAHALPPPRSFESGGLVFEADYGVFSPGRVDPGSELLLRIALEGDPVEAVADIGTGYGALALSLVARGRARRAVATEVDSIAAWLAERNARAARAELRLAFDPDPVSVEATPLTLCNVPTHLDASGTAALMAGLGARASGGRVLAVVHAGLEERYARYFPPRVTRHRGGEYVVFDSPPA